MNEGASRRDFMVTTAIPNTKISGGSFLLEERRPEEVFTPEDFTEQHQLIGQTAEEFAVNEILPNAEKIEHKDFSISRELLKKAGDLGLSAVEIPEAYGGLEMDKVTAAVIADHIAKYAGFATTWGAHSGIGMLPHRLFRHRRAEEEIPAAAGRRGDRGRICFVGSVVRLGRAELPHSRRSFRPTASITFSTAKKCGSPTPASPTCSPYSRKLTAKSSPRFWSRKLSRGFSIGAEEHKMGIRGSSTCPIILNDCKVPVENLLGEIGKGHVIAFNILNVGRFKLGAMCVGGGRVSLENAIGYAKQRKAFGKVDCRLRTGARKDRQHGDAALCRRIARLSHRRHDGRGAWRSRQVGRRRGAGDAQGDRGIRGRVFDHQSLGLGDDRLRRRRDSADLRWLRICRRISGGARLSRRPHQSHFRRHERNQPADHHRLSAEARDDRAVAADARDQEADGRSALRVLRPAKNSKARWPKNANWWRKPRSWACLPPARRRRNICRRFRTSRKSWARSPT